MPEDMPDHMPEDMPDRMSNRMSEDMSDRMPEDLPVRKCINDMVGITRSKVFFLGRTKMTIIPNSHNFWIVQYCKPYPETGLQIIYILHIYIIYIYHIDSYSIRLTTVANGSTSIDHDNTWG